MQSVRSRKPSTQKSATKVTKTTKTTKAPKTTVTKPKVVAAQSSKISTANKTKTITKSMEKLKKPILSQTLTKSKRLSKPEKKTTGLKAKPKPLESKLGTISKPKKTVPAVNKSKMFVKQTSGILKSKMRGPPVLMSITYLDTDISGPTTTKPHQIVDNVKVDPKPEKKSSLKKKRGKGSKHKTSTEKAESTKQATTEKLVKKSATARVK